MPNDPESPDHAGLRADARVSEDDAIALLDKLEGETQNGHCVADIDDVLDALLGAHAKGHTAGRDSQSAELATLRGDNAEFQKEVNALAGQVQELTAAGQWTQEIPTEEGDYGFSIQAVWCPEVHHVYDTEDKGLCLYVIEGDDEYIPVSKLAGSWWCKIELPPKPVEAK